MSDVTRKREEQPAASGPGYDPQDPNYPKYHLHIDCAPLSGGTIHLEGPHTFTLAPTLSLTKVELTRERAVDGRPTLRLRLIQS